MLWESTRPANARTNPASSMCGKCVGDEHTRTYQEKRARSSSTSSKADRNPPKQCVRTQRRIGPLMKYCCWWRWRGGGSSGGGVGGGWWWAAAAAVVVVAENVKV